MFRIGVSISVTGGVECSCRLDLYLCQAILYTNRVSSARRKHKHIYAMQCALLRIELHAVAMQERMLVDEIRIDWVTNK